MVFANSCCLTYLPYISNHTKLPVILYLGEPYRKYYEANPENTWKALSIDFKLKNLKKYIRDHFSTYSKRIRVYAEIEAAKKYTKILVNSMYSRESVIRAYGIDATVCYLGIDTEKFNCENILKEPYVVGVGSISNLKNIHKSIEIISKIEIANRPKLKWVGNIADEHYLEEIKTLAKILQVDFSFYINVSDDKLKEILSKAAIMMYTSKLEPFGLAPLEANACGTFVVAIAEGGIRESITNKKNGILVSSYVSDEFNSVISEFTKDLKYASKEGEKAKKFVIENWGISKLKTNILKEINTIVS